MADYEAVVRRLLECREPIEPLNGSCVLCGEYVSGNSRKDDHSINCPWRMAKEAING